MNDFTKITRVEVIDEHGRSYVNWKNNNIVDIKFQDEGRTIKIFISQNVKKNNIERSVPEC